jgi:Uma2 family endonuclease
MEICNNQQLQNLPYKIQTDKWGNLLMSPATNEHGIYQAKLVQLLSKLTDTGVIITECSVQTQEGVKVMDVAWASDAFMNRNRTNTPYQEAPEICIEILSPSNTLAEMEEKRELYFAKGAKEVWLCKKNGDMIFYTHLRKLQTSELLKTFPRKVETFLGRVIN